MDIRILNFLLSITKDKSAMLKYLKPHLERKNQHVKPVN